MDKKKRLITMVVTLLVLTIGVTFAYFMARTGEGKQAGTTITADTVDDLKFNVSKENLSLNINQFNFASGAGNLTDNVTATASLKANSTKKQLNIIIMSTFKLKVMIIFIQQLTKSQR